MKSWVKASIVCAQYAKQDYQAGRIIRADYLYFLKEAHFHALKTRFLVAK